MNFLVTDTETTGLNKEVHALIEIACIPVINGVKKDPFVSYCRPHKGAIIDPRALEINKLTFDQIMAFPPAEEVIPKFIDWLDSQETLFALLGHNIPFDRGFIYKWMCRHGHYGAYITRFRPNNYCTLEMAREVFKGKRVKPDKMNLAALCRFFKIDLSNSHSALPDTEAAYEVYQNLKPMMPKNTEQKSILSYSEKRRKYLGTRYIMFNEDGSMYINDLATKDPEAARFIAEELYHLFWSV